MFFSAQLQVLGGIIFWEKSGGALFKRSNAADHWKINERKVSSWENHSKMVFRFPASRVWWARPPKWPPWLLYGPKYQLWMSVTPMPISHPIHHQITGWRASQLQPSMIWGVADLCYSAFRLRAWEHFSEATQASKVASVGARWSRHAGCFWTPNGTIDRSPKNHGCWS